MRRYFAYRIFILSVSIIVMMSVGFLFLNTRSLDRQAYDKYSVAASSQTAIMAQKLTSQLNQFEKDIEYLGKDLSYDQERDIYLIQNFLKNQKGVEGIFLFDSDRQLVGEYGQLAYKDLIDKDINEKFFYEALIWSYQGQGIYTIYYKVTYSDIMYVGFSLNLNDFADFISTSPYERLAVFDPSGDKVIKTLNDPGEFNDLSFKNDMFSGFSQTRFENNAFFSYQAIDHETNLVLLYQMSDQSYAEVMRRHLLRNILLIGLILAITLLVSWRIIRSLVKYVVVKNLSEKDELKTFKTIHEEITRTISWLDKVISHYDELTVLRQDLELLNKDIPGVGGKDENQKT